MQREEAIQQGLVLINRSQIAMLGTVGADGYPHIRAMLNMEHNGWQEVWFSTNTSSAKVTQIARNSKACVYFVDFEQWMGLTLVGEVELLQDVESKQRLWREGFEKYYPLGVNDPDYSVLRFTARHGSYYHGLCVVKFEV